ncbi:DoxX family protein [Poriferisphaera corsica]|nr:DoxX family protein [Poriferisphaera corsica]
MKGGLSVLGRLFLVLIFVMSALGNKVPNFESMAGYMASEGMPMPKVMLVGAIVFMVVGGALVFVGFKARIGAGLLAVFLVLATYYFHDFWTFVDAGERQMQTIAFMKNLALLGAMLFIVANGAGAWSVDRLIGRGKSCASEGCKTKDQKEKSVVDQ